MDDHALLKEVNHSICKILSNYCTSYVIVNCTYGKWSLITWLTGVKIVLFMLI